MRAYAEMDTHIAAAGGSVVFCSAVALIIQLARLLALWREKLEREAALKAKGVAIFKPKSKS